MDGLAPDSLSDIPPCHVVIRLHHRCLKTSSHRMPWLAVEVFSCNPNKVVLNDVVLPETDVWQDSAGSAGPSSTSEFFFPRHCLLWHPRCPVLSYWPFTRAFLCVPPSDVGVRCNASASQWQSNPGHPSSHLNQWVSVAGYDTVTGVQEH